MNKAVKTVLIIILLGVISFFGLRTFKEYQFRNQYNEAVELLNADDIQSAETAFDTLLQSHGQHQNRDLIISRLLQCYRHYTENPSLPAAERSDYARKIQELAPGELTDEEKLLLQN